MKIEDIEKQARSETKVLQKVSSKGQTLENNPSKSSRCKGSSKAKSKSPKSELKNQTDVNKTGVVSSDSNKSLTKKIKDAEINGASTNKTDKVNSESDVANRKKKSKVTKNSSIGESIKSKDTKSNNNSDSASSKKLTKKTEMDSDEDADFINPTPERSSIRKRKLQINSDSDDDESEMKNNKKLAKPPNLEKLKPVSISEIFSGKVSQSKVKTAVQSQETVVKKKKKIKTELGTHADENFEKTLIDLDDDIFLQNEDILDKTIDGALYENLDKKNVEMTNDGLDEKQKLNVTENVDNFEQDMTPKIEKTSGKRPHNHENG